MESTLEGDAVSGWTIDSVAMKTAVATGIVKGLNLFLDIKADKDDEDGNTGKE